MDIAHNLRSIRKERGLSQTDVAEMLQTTQQQYSKYEKGLHDIPASRIIALCKIFDISADWLLGLTDCDKEHSND